MMKSRIAAAAALLAVAGAANAEMSVDAAFVSDYDWRGLSQSENSGAFQLGGKYSFDSGFYTGLWGSTLGGHSYQSEIDVFAGYAGEFSNSGVGFDVGANYYTYTNEDDANFVELYAGLNYGVFNGKLSFAPEFLGYNNDEAFYVEGNAALPIANGFSFLAHVGYSFGDGVKQAYAGDNYFDWSAGIGYDVGNFSAFVKYVDGSDVSSSASDQSRFVFGLSTTLPWGN
jgi:uncharacterized protein (TIGR02001 family)